MYTAAHTENYTLSRLFFSLRQRLYSSRAIMVLLSLATKENIHLLLADDDDEDRDIFVTVMSEISDRVKVIQARNGKQVLDILNSAETLPDIIFLDLNMPLMGGADCLKALKANPRFKKIPVFIYSTSSTKEHVDETFLGGANLYIPKPESYTALRKMAQFVLGFNPSNYTRPKRDDFLIRFN